MIGTSKLFNELAENPPVLKTSPGFYKKRAGTYNTVNMMNLDENSYHSKEQVAAALREAGKDCVPIRSQILKLAKDIMLGERGADVASLRVELTNFAYPTVMEDIEGTRKARYVLYRPIPRLHGW